MTDESRTCPACGGTELSWGSTIRGPTGVAQGRHHTGELTVQVFLGCACGETIEVHDLDEFLGGVEPVRRRVASAQRKPAQVVGYLGALSTSLPTEPGKYLFCGVRDGRMGLDLYEARFHHRAEIVRAVYDAKGKLRFTGVDFFWEPSKVVGVWTRFGPLEEQLVTAADPLLFDAAVRYTVAGWVESWHGTPWALDKKGLVHALCRHHGRVKDHSLVERAVDRAIELGLFEETEPGQWTFVGSRR